jgi:hypothetical protein
MVRNISYEQNSYLMNEMPQDALKRGSVGWMGFFVSKEHFVIFSSSFLNTKNRQVAIEKCFVFGRGCHQIHVLLATCSVQKL